MLCLTINNNITYCHTLCLEKTHRRRKIPYARKPGDRVYTCYTRHASGST